jgi:hypothetical protein
MTCWQLRELADQVRTIPLESVLQQSGAQPDRYDQRKWHTPQGVLSVTGAKFMNWTYGCAGGGAIDLVMHLHNLRFQEAVQWLRLQFPGARWPEAIPRCQKPELALPPPDPSKLWRVRRYLVQERRLPAALVDSLIQSGHLYADGRANAVFLLLGKENKPVGAELRGTTSRPWHGMAPGSQKDLGYFAIPIAPLSATILVESAIDAISCFALHPQHRCISTAGARPNPGWLAALLGQGYPVYCGFDADPTGETMARAMIALAPGVQRFRPPQHDWNDVLKARA